MTSQSHSYRGYRFPREIISHAVWLYNRFCLSFRDVEDLPPQGTERAVRPGYALVLLCLRSAVPSVAGSSAWLERVD